MTLSTFSAISPVDGRYASKTASLRPYFSEYALVYHRLLVEIRWLESLANHPKICELAPLKASGQAYLEEILNKFTEQEALRVKQHEQHTNHDVKAVEYYLAEQLAKSSELQAMSSFIHFACTSEDINNLAYALMMKSALAQVIQPTLAEIVGGITLLGKSHGDVAMLSRTHGQAATPTTLGKELINFSARLKRPLQQLAEVWISGKCNGAVGNYNAHLISYPDLDWRLHCQKFVTSLGLSFNAYTTQIEPHDGIAEIAHLMIRINNILLDYTKDIWSYISLGYFKQKTNQQEVGSSTMPHKVNPIDFENAEGNLGLSNALFQHFANKLTTSRLQRDLSDSTVMRNIGVAFSYALIAYQSIAKGNEKLQLNESRIAQDLSQSWEVLSEAIQTVMRRYHVPNAYEKMRDLTRGQGIDQARLATLIESLEIPAEAKQRLRELRPETYIGLATPLVKSFS